MGRKEGDLFARVPPEWIPELDRRAAAEGLNRSILVRRAVRAFLTAGEPAAPQLSAEEERLLELWRILRQDAPEVADALLRLAGAALGHLPERPGGRRSVRPPAEAGKLVDLGNGQ